ncbi:MAG: DUF3887 domain-containing protein [Candidatus Hydrogenedentes bacterium]|nr:DUF3887 domain-containing protein [Candidatus Hydrogenedentota bacterium]
MTTPIRSTIAALVLLLTLGLSACNQQKTVPAEETVAPAGDSTETRATQFVDLLAAKNFSAAVAQFDATMTAALPEATLATTWAQVEQQAGAFQRSTGTRAAAEQGYDVVYVTCQFERASLNAKVVYDKEGKIAGLFFQP